MPLAHIHIGKGRANHEQKKQLISKITAAFVEILGSDQDKVWVLLHEIPRSEWGVGGKPLAEPER
jgi:4-oxalocrotonate tautomerase